MMPSWCGGTSPRFFDETSAIIVVAVYQLCNALLHYAIVYSLKNSLAFEDKNLQNLQTKITTSIVSINYRKLEYNIAAL